jgi:prolyl oligopeptidase
MARNTLLAIGAGCILLVSTGHAAAQSNPTLKALADDYWEAVLRRHPTRATALGDHRFDDRLADLSDRSRLNWERGLRALLTRVDRVPEQGLTPEDRLTRDLLKRSIRDRIARLECRLDLTPMDPLYGRHIAFPLILVSQPFRNAADFDAYASRLRAFPQQITDIIANMRNGVRLGVVSPRMIVEKTIPQIRTHIVADVTRSEFYKPLKDATNLTEPERKTATELITDAISASVIPAYLQLLAYVEDEYLHAARPTIGMSAVTNGDRIYRTLVHLHTTLRTTPDEIHQLGLAEVARLRNELAKVQAEIGFEGTLNEFIQHMRTDPRQRFKTADELVAAADGYLTRMKTLLPRLFGRLPKADCVMKEMESFRAPSAPVAFYNASPEDASRPGYFYINTYAPTDRLRFTLEALTYHEAVPGHHLQAALDQENADLPRFRRYGGYNAYVEGWALYAEKLGYEVGGYRDPLSRYGQLTFEIWRACRLVVDTGIHLEGWTRRQAIDYMKENTSLADLDIEAEVDRYIAWPGQALAYKMGELRILRLRRDAEKQLGDRFDLRAFHDALLFGGAMPIDTLETRMKAWIEAKSGS